MLSCGEWRCMCVSRAPLHSVFLRSPLVSGPVAIGVRPRLHVQAVTIILGNDLANGKIFPISEVIENPIDDLVFVSESAADSLPSVFPACVVTCVYKRRYSDVDLSDSFLCSEDDPVKAEPPVEKEEKCVSDSLLPATPDLSIEDQHGARSQRSQEADKPHRRKGEKKYSCDECGKNFTHLGNFKAHQLVHSGDKPYRCDLCGKRFTQKGHLKSHQRIHSGVKPYSCELCGKSFTHPASLKTHQVIHGGVKPYSCELCGKSFTHSASLKTHQVIHSGVKPYSCELCGKAFTCSGNLQRHQLIHSGIKAYSCGQCGKAFARSSTLQRHQVTHSGFKPYSCDLCGKSFNDPADLKKHQLIHIGVKVYIDDPVKAEPPVEKEEKCVSDSLLPATPDLSIEVSKADFVHVQQNDPTLAKCLLAVSSNEQTPMFTALATTC
ncbi:zinc finger protein 239-like isoform X2 [Simochromis diagramma]|uniref:zinc finger protein 239-like isoform X2 n=1 Tax=Simochromis diagramma TaxID=43689 RepID=UPI001A7E2679|nr:zinc finger protein 239-like isoform X2 [Simochromis diagramma]